MTEPEVAADHGRSRFGLSLAGSGQDTLIRGLLPYFPPILVVSGTEERAMCHEYGMRWWKSERSEKKPTEEAKPDLMGVFAVRREGEPKAAPAIGLGEEKRVEEKELVPAK